MGRHPTGRFTSGSTTARGHRLANPRDPAVRLALTKPCPVCKVDADEWCVGIDERDGSRTRGRRLTRIHFDRCEFVPTDAPVKAGAR